MTVQNYIESYVVSRVLTIENGKYENKCDILLMDFYFVLWGYKFCNLRFSTT